MGRAFCAERRLVTSACGTQAGKSWWVCMSPVVMSLGFGASQTYPESWLCHCISQKLPQQRCVIKQPRAQAHSGKRLCSLSWVCRLAVGLGARARQGGSAPAAGGAQVCRSVSIPELRLTWGPQLQAMAEVGGASPVGSVHLESFLLWHLLVSCCPLT